MHERIRFPDEGTKQAHSFPNGLAHTILFAEKYAECSYWALTSGDQVPWYVATETSGFHVGRAIPCDPSLPQTPHGNGMPVGLADGSVKVVRAGIDPSIWYRAHQAEGHVIH